MTRLIFAVLISATAVCGQGYRLTANAIRVDQGEHWREWIFQNDVVRTLNERGRLHRPVFVLGRRGAAPARRDSGQRRARRRAV